MTQSCQTPVSTRAALLLSSAMTVMAGAGIAPSLPAMSAHFAHVRGVEEWVRLVLTVPALFIVLTGPAAGVAVDKLGRRPVLVASLLLYAVAGSSGLLVDSLPALLAGRALLGVAVGGIMTSATALIADYFSGRERESFLGIQASFMAYGGVCFLVVSGLLADVGWRLPFAVYLFAFGVLGFVAWAVREPAGIQSERRMPSPGGSAAARSTFQSLVPIYVIAVLVQVLFYIIPIHLPFLLAERGMAGGARSGFAMATGALVTATTALFYRRLHSRLGHVTIAAATFCLMGAGHLTIGVGSRYGVVLAGLACMGIGFGPMIPNLSVWVTAKAPASMRGRAVGGLTTSFFLGQFLSPIVTRSAATRFGIGSIFMGAGAGLVVASALALAIYHAIARPSARV